MTTFERSELIYISPVAMKQNAWLIISTFKPTWLIWKFWELAILQRNICPTRNVISKLFWAKCIKISDTLNFRQKKFVKVKLYLQSANPSEISVRNMSEVRQKVSEN